MPDPTSSGEPPIRALGRIVETQSPILGTAEMANGFRTLAHVPPWLADEGMAIAEGDAVVLELTPFDFSKGRVVARAHAG
ncbi:MAG: hypothetical protein R3F11_24440 [Verrucomicrobiales bacterium]